MSEPKKKRSAVALGLETTLAMIKLISPNEKNQEAKSIKQKGLDIKAAFKIHRKLYRRMKKGGISEKEQDQLGAILDSIVEAEKKHLLN